MLDARARVTGAVEYTINREVPGMLRAKLLRSRVAHARIARVDVARARQVPGVALVLTGRDLLQRADLSPQFGPVLRDQPLLAIDRVRFVGDPVVAVVAEDLDAAQEALDLVEVDYEELPAVFDACEALQPGAPILHEEPASKSSMFADVIVHNQPGTNQCNYFRIRKGDVGEGFAAADHVFEDTFTSPPVQHVPLETHACLAEVQGDRIVVWATTQTPFVLRSQLADVFRVPVSKIRVIVPTLGGGYGAKTYPKIEPLTAVLAYLTRRPVKLHLSREEEFVTVTKHGMRITMKTGVTRDGKLVARQSTCYFNTGAYADIGPRLIIYGGYGTGGPYFIPNVWVDSYAAYTNLPPAGAFRGYGITQSGWAHETHMDMIADRLGWDPYEFRMQNLLVDGQTYSTNDVLEDCHFRELLRSGAEWIGWDHAAPIERNGSKARARGLSVMTCRSLPLAVSTAAAKLNEDGTLNVLTSSVEMGQGVKTAMAILAAEALQVPIDRVEVSNPDTDLTPYDQQTSASRSTFAMGGAVQAACADVKQQLVALASDLLEADPSDLEIEDGQVRVRGAPNRALDFGAIVRASRQGNLLGQGRHRAAGALDPDTGLGVGPSPGHWHQSVGAAEVEVDLDTGKVELLRYRAGIYAGRVVNPVQAELQTEGSVAFGLGQALFEEMVFDGGQLQNGNLGDYMIASLQDLPRELDVELLEHPERSEIHGLGEPSLPPVMPAVGNAVSRATGVRIQDLPITPEKILRGLYESSGTNATTRAIDASPPTNFQGNTPIKQR
jgi:CO/xanthine dehydrogenase Mo-binding subunit